MVFIIIGFIPIYYELWKRQGRVVEITSSSNSESSSDTSSRNSASVRLCQAAKAHGMSFDEFMRLERDGGNSSSSSSSSSSSISAHCELGCSPDDCARKSPPPYAVPNVNLEGGTNHVIAALHIGEIDAVTL
ncbi:hypothetical protein I7I51_07897 [Histoplasma capsulatum]|uniref:Uncharacterized protein n=2 Tax=Histoplasma TaxID=5036 RepID=A0A8A1LXH1_AJECA|nr:hypothetical protein I7I51_07897 [Histoplasma capsulatum]